MHQNLDTLGRYLAAHGIAFQQWGRGEAKSLASLQEELEAGECSLVLLADRRLVRHLEVAVAYIFSLHDDNSLLRLREIKQVFLAPPRERTRDHIYPSVSEKMKRNEDPQQAIDRALYGEELRLSGPVQKIYVGASVHLEDSQSFPGLATEYKCYKFFVLIHPQDYRPQGYVEDQSTKAYDPKITYFEWRPA
jgi:hypothetical protein